MIAQLVQSYLFFYLFALGIALGSFAWLAIHGLTGGEWGESIREPLLACVAAIPYLAIAFLPVLLGAKLIFPWLTTSFGDKSAYLNLPFFIVRAAIYFACWIALSIVTVRRRRVPVPGPSLVLYVVTMTFASWDWMMSLEPKWWSTIYAMNVIAGQALSALAFVIVVIVLAGQPRAAVLHDLGNLLLAGVMFSAYLAFSQFLVIWSGNTKDEIAWYLSRIETSWRWLAIALMIFAFFAPFLVLLFRAAKRNPTMMAVVAGVVLLMRFVDLFWTIAPAFHPRGIFVSWIDVVILVIATYTGMRRYRVRPAQ